MKNNSPALAVNKTKQLRRGLLLAVALMFLRHNAPAAQAPILLGSTATFGVLGASTVTSTGGTMIFGDLGVSPGTAVTGSPGVTGTLHLGDPAAAQAQSDLTIAYNDAAGRTVGFISVAGDLGGQTLAPGLYNSLSSLEISSGNLILAGSSNAVWIFQMGSTLATSTSRQIVLSGGAQAANIFWQVGSSATLAGNSVFKGTIMAAQSITMGTGATLEGRALARVGSVTLAANTITVPHAANAAGTMVAWGKNDHGQTNVPPGLSLVTAMAGGEADTAALKSDGTMLAWGDNLYGQTTIPAGLSAVKAIAAGGHHTVALKRDGTLAAWGDNAYGQTLIPLGLIGVTAIAAGESHTAALKSDGTVVAWGDNSYSQTNVPPGLSGVTALAAGSGHTVALKSNGTMVAWGANDFFLQSTIPAGLNGVIAIAAGASHTVALKSNGTVVAWGNNYLGQSTVPAGLSGVTAIAAGNFHTVALKSDGTVVAWGLNDDGQTTVPANLRGVTAIAAGWYHTTALLGPIITTQPLAQSFTLGAGATLSISVMGTGLTYQWQRDGTDIPGATNSTLNLANLLLTQAGAYHVVVNSIAGGAVTSQDALLVLLSFGDLKFYAGITLTGTVGQQFRVEYTEALGIANWLTLTNLTLPFSPYLVIDPNSPGQAKRFYRAVPLL
jgi:hypothetical protein